MKTRIIVTGSCFDYFASIDGEPGKWGFGRTPEKAVSDLIGKRLGECKDGIEIIYGSTTEVTRS